MPKKKRDFDGRETNALDRLGTEHPCCRSCGNRDWRCLELHHIAGRTFSDDQVIECKNCHAILSDAQNDHPNTTNFGAPDFQERLAQFLLGLGDFLALLAERLKEFGKELPARISAIPENKGNAS
jgi:hypothetical protein